MCDRVPSFGLVQLGVDLGSESAKAVDSESLPPSFTFGAYSKTRGVKKLYA